MQQDENKAFFWAIEKGYTDIAIALLDNSADSNAIDKVRILYDF
jgi:hypothetical protein